MEMYTLRTSLASCKYSRCVRVPDRRSHLSCRIVVPGSKLRYPFFQFRKSFVTCQSQSPVMEPMESYTSEKDLKSTKIPSQIREKVEKVVEGQGYRVTVGDVAGQAGVTLAEAEAALQALASDSLGSLEVSSEGEVVYILPTDFRSVIRSKSFWIRMEPRIEQTQKALAKFARIAFGVLFVVIVLAVWIAILTGSKDGDKDRDRSSSSDGGRMFINILDIVRIWQYWNYDYIPPQNPEELSFIESVFSYMFGDGDPNKELEKYRWALIGRSIRDRGGVVIAEEIAPYLDLPQEALDEEDSVIVNEGYMLPVLTRFRGEPIVTEDGKLIYVFPKFQTTGVERLPGMRSSIPLSGGQYLAEEKWKFSRATTANLMKVVGFVVLNLVGVGILTSSYSQSVAANTLVNPKLWLPGLLLLQCYAASFVVIPVIRWLMNRGQNRAIDLRNQLRKKSASRLERMTASLKAKIEFARRLGKRTLIKEEDVIYSSAKDLASQTEQWEQEIFDEQLKRLN